MHVPAQLIRAFKAKCSDWFDALDGGVKVDPRNDVQRPAKGLGTRLQYMAKGAPRTGVPPLWRTPFQGRARADRHQAGRGFGTALEGSSGTIKRPDAA